MQTLAIKYRPKTFDDVVEQGPIKAILMEQLKTKTHKNSYLFTGGAGTGKTTCARIFANELNQGQGNPIEVDAASNNGVENVRSIIDNAKFKSIESTYKVYIIDECHMLSTGAWNAMLKLLEEPPMNTIFILCTTDPQKIPATILSRVQRYDFQRISYKSVIARLEYILKAEELEEESVDLIEYQPEALAYIAKIADGGMRDAVTLLDKCLSYNRHDLSTANVIEALGTVNYDTMIQLTNGVWSRDLKGVMIEIEETYRRGVDLKQFVKNYLQFLLDVRKYYLIQDFEYVNIPSSLEEWLRDCINPEENADSLQYPEFIGRLMQSMIQLSVDIKWESAPKALIEATFLVLCETL